jgi:hypothetical protein
MSTWFFLAKSGMTCWDIIKPDVLIAFQCIYIQLTCPLPKLNRGLITLLPKKDVSEAPSEFRPISLIHTFTKLISMVLALRLAPLMDNLVSSAQSTFIEHRCIQDNFLYVRNLARAYHRKKMSALLQKLDISKAFDSVSWEYLIEMMQHRGFLARWCNWLSLLFASSSSSVRLNGVHIPWLKHRLGLWQGNHLSPFLFILAIDALQFILQRATDEEVLTPMWDRTTRLRLSLYANDVAVFMNPVKSYIDVIMEILHNFGEATGLRINLDKSTVAPIRCAQVNLDELLQVFQDSIVSFPMKYLGLPITLGSLKFNHLQSVFDQAANKLAGRQSGLLNIGGHRELVKSVLSSLPTYLLTAIKAPKGFYKAIDKIRRRFL